MKLNILIGCLLMLLFNCEESKENNPLNADYEQALNETREVRAKNRVKYLELTGLFKLDSTNNTFGKASSNKFVLNIENLAATIGNLNLSSEGLRFNAAKEIKVTNSSGKKIESLTLEIDSNGNSIQLFHEQLKWQVITRSGELYLRVWDFKNPAIKAFKGFKNYATNSEYIFKADFSYFETTHLESVQSKLGIPDVIDFIGQVQFNYKKASYTLDVGREGFVMVRDLTSGESTYGGGRYIYIDLPETNGTVTLDFNYLYNPPCAYSEFTTCLFPPRQNQLDFSVKAGELLEKSL